AQYGWNVDGPEVEEHAASFMRAFYGAGNEGLLDAYRTLQYQARAWQNSWDREVSKVRGPGYGNSYGKGIGVVRYDQTLAVPPLPDAELGYTPAFRAKYAERVALAHKLAVENEQLRYTLTAAVGKVERNRYNLEVFGSLTRFIAQQWQLLLALEAAEGSLSQAAGAAKGGRHAQAVGRAVAAFNGVRRQQADSRAAFDGLKAVYEKSRYPQGRTVNGRAFLQVLDDTKDHWAGRRADLSYLRAPEESLQLNAWLTALRGTIEAYAKKHNVPVKGLAEARLEE
ncbi:MAG: hypothetical protein IT162_15700, partial [Bryobacterales bacterium]|nr:hypothetical protein [Bryobacterales bacterium]